MRRLILIFLLFVLPLQASWAAACAYCPDDCATELSATTPDKQAAVLDFDDDCSGCQLGAIGIATSVAAPSIFPPPLNQATGEHHAIANASEPDRPERPKWTRAA